MSAQPLERRLQLAGMLVIVGLVIEALCLYWSQPIAFVLFLGLGGLCIGLGVLLYLFSLISHKQIDQ